jgi:hypothetical protein
MHTHYPTCAKGGRKGNHEDCRMGFDRPLVDKSQLTDDGSILLRRTHGNLVSFIPSLLLACPFNHFMSLTLDASRHARERLLWEDAQRSGSTQASMMVGGHLLADDQFGPCLMVGRCTYLVAWALICDYRPADSDSRVMSLLS